MGKLWARVSSPEMRGCIPHSPWTQRKGLFLMDFLVCCKGVSRSDFQDEPAARVRTCPARIYSEPVESLAIPLSLSGLSSIPVSTSALLLTSAGTQPFCSKPCWETLS